MQLKHLTRPLVAALGVLDPSYVHWNLELESVMASRADVVLDSCCMNGARL